ncbi:MAG TPA: hypothetical protein VF629_17385 [Hymenobacter sp.]|uniref:c-type cytochrome n=1 Tax=Hymenobacter sp. TaxID=1898978 RepID=UPI002EDB64EF
MRRLLPLFPFHAWAGALSLLCTLAAGCTYSHGSEPGPCNDTEPVTYSKVVAPILATHCYECHGPTVYTTLGYNTNLSTYQSVRGQSAEYILGAVRHEVGFAAMPKNRPKMSDCDIARLQAWVDAGRPNN